MKAGIARSIVVCLVFGCLVSCSDDKSTSPEQPIDILTKLEALPGVEVAEIEPGHEYCERQFELLVTQPVDHDNPGGPTFQQQVFVSHVSEDAPMVLVTGGYEARNHYAQEITKFLATNQIYTGYRYFEGSRPEPTDWEYLTLEQAAADNHHVVELLQAIYDSTWISAGHSKSGRTALVHRRFYPDDVVATVAYVAAIPEGREDSRYMDWLNSMGTETCRTDQKAFQRAVLLHRDEIAPLLQDWYENRGDINTLDPDIILEWLATEYRYTVWQAGAASCDNIPDSTDSANDIFTHLITSCWHTYMYSDDWREHYWPWHYEAFTESGGLVMDAEHLWDMLVHITPDGADMAYLCPPGVDLTFRAEVMPDILNWLKTSGNNIIYIYGEYDHVTAAAVEPGASTNALRFIHPGGWHDVKMEDLADRDVVIATLESWTGIDFPEF